MTGEGVEFGAAPARYKGRLFMYNGKVRAALPTPRVTLIAVQEWRPHSTTPLPRLCLLARRL
jgi:hypothetical protein